MFPHTIKTCLQKLLIVSLICVACGQERKLTPKLNPGCMECTSKDILVYIRADGPNDTLHVFWDFITHSFGSPSVNYAVTSLNATLDIHWHGVQPEVRYSEVPKYVFSSGIREVYEYNDLKDLGYFNESMPYHKHKLEDLKWTLKESVLTGEEVMVHASGQYKARHASGIVDVKLDLVPYSGYAKQLPRLIHTANSTLVDVALVNWTLSSGYNNSRYAIQFLMVSSDDPHDTMHRENRESLDDEHTPGVFEIIEITTPESFKSDDGGFVQFRPVGYTNPKRDVATSTSMHVSNFRNASFIPDEQRGIKGFYHDGAVYSDSILAQEVMISIGLPGDGFYKEYNFTSWSYTMGYGRPPMEGFSLFVVIIICVGLGVPVLLALSGITYVIVRRYKQRNAPTRFIDEE